MNVFRKTILTIALATASVAAIASANSWLDELSYKEKSISGNLNQHIYTIEMKNGRSESINLYINEDGYETQDIRFPREITGQDVYNLIEFQWQLRAAFDAYENSNPNVKLRFEVNGDQIRTAIKGPKSKLASIRKDTDKILNSVTAKVAEEYFHFVQIGTESYFDYKFAAKLQRIEISKMMAKIKPLMRTMTDNEKLDFLLRISQEIPYDKATMSNSFYRTPVAVLADNKGDCDEKATLLAAMLKNTFPSKKVGVLTTKGQSIDHAVAVIEWDSKGKHTLKHKGGNFVPLETTADVRPGVISQETHKSISDKRFNIHYI